MSKIIDLTREISNNMPVYPGDDEVKLYQTNYINKDGYNNHGIETGMHIGTHVDGPMHMTDSNIYISEMELDKFIGRGILIDAKNETIIDYKEEYEEIILEDSIVVINTGFSEEFGTEIYFKKHPVVSENLAELLVRKKIKALCIDAPSPDRYPFEVHKLLLKNSILIGENLANLDKLEGIRNYEIFIVPLNIRADGSMARIFARIE
ncbi:cyclase family protein [Clostridium sp. YIM B02515]|uniref:Cyclase family protein n=1 Tax=Clostridium rhizosphaerae TaxID=2803861 RepID=A0ABS1TES8_9CLOT|nr:cyclase family protein [Clostridium rhizosphaerae]MBL4937252.1 cyclase family protein [Clostridium rhizosphaerae]